MIELPQHVTGAGPRRALLVHGLSSDHTSWWRLTDHLVAEGWSVTTVDLRGHGVAPRASSYSLADYASDLPGVGWDLVIGHSLGGAASVIAAQQPGFADRLVLIDPVLDVPPELFDDIVADQVAELEYTAETIAADKPHWHERDRAAKLDGVRRVDPAAVMATFTDTGRWDVTTLARALTVPTLILSGDPGVYTMLDPATAQSLPAEYVVIAGAGHSPHRDRPEETLEALRRWLLSGR